MIVEDEVIIAMVLERQLAQLGCRVIGPVASGEGAIRLAAEQVPDLVLMDVRLAGELDGIESMRQIRLAEATRSLPVVFMTAYNSALIQNLISDFHPIAFLEKPISPATLDWVIKHYLEVHGSPRAG
jgi:CheY-like chemotaxis protein